MNYLILIPLLALVFITVFLAIKEQFAKNDGERDWLTKEEAEAFTGENGAYYLNKWKNRPESHLKGWNWAAAFFFVEWLAYRKMYLASAITLPGPWIGFPGRRVPIAVFIFAGLYRFMGDAPAIVASILIARFLGGGLLGNAYYRNAALSALKKSLPMGEAERLAYLRDRGGVNPLAPVIAVVAQASIAIALILYS